MSFVSSIDIVIPCYNVGHIVDKCIASILNQNHTDKVKIYLVEDGSTDNTKQVIDQFAHNGNIKIIYHKLNQGLAAARNSGINAGCGEVILFLDSDMTVNPDWIDKLLVPFSNKNIVGVVGEQELPSQLTANSLDRYLYSKYRGARQFRQSEHLHFRYFLFSNTGIRRLALNEVGIFDEKIKSYGGEDLDLALRVWKQYPTSLRFVSGAVSYHWGQKTISEFYQNMELYGGNNFKYLIDKHPLYIKEFGGDLVNSFKGKILFNLLIKLVVYYLSKMKPHPIFIRYLIIYSTIKGAQTKNAID